MKSTKMLTLLVLGMMTWLVGFTQAAPMGTAWTYQGRLMDANYPADGLYDFQFGLFDDPCTGTLQASMIKVNDLDVIDGYFTVLLDFGSSVFDGNSIWLETTVAQADGSDPCTLRPRIEITPVPYALQTRGIFVDANDNVGIGMKDLGSFKFNVCGDASNNCVLRSRMSGTKAGSHANLLIEHLTTYTGTNHYAKYGLDIEMSNNLWNGNAYGILINNMSTNDKFVDGKKKYGIFINSNGSFAGGSGDPTNNYALYISSSAGADNNYGIYVAPLADNYFAGNVGIGTASPSSKLHIEDNTTGDVRMMIHNLDNTGTERLYFGTNTSDAGMIVWGSNHASYPGKWRFFNNKTSSHYDWIAGGSVRMTLDNNGNLGIGNDSPTGKLDVRSSSELATAEIRNSSSSGVAYGVNVLATGAGGTSHYAGRFSASGATNNYAIYADGVNSKSYFKENVGIGTMYPSYMLHVVGSAAKTTGIYWTNISDRRLKENIKPLEGALDRLTRLQGRTFKWKDAAELNATEGTHIGLVAQEVEEVFPQWVSEDNQGRKQVTLEGLEAVTIEAIKELKAENELLKKRLEILEQKLDTSQSTVNKEAQ